MDVMAWIARAFHMTDEVWERHASPWSVWTRVPTIVPLLAAIWSHTAIGGWAVVAVGAVALWSWLNPRIFPPPASTDTWASKAVMGERVWLNRAQVPIPGHHARTAGILAAIAGLGFIPAVIGAFLNEAVPTLAGGVTALLAKLWFCDRMVWLYEDMKDKNPRYRAWLR